MRIIGDCHDKFDAYYNIASQVESSIQIGDFGFGAWNKLFYSNLGESHKIIPGNHEDYSICLDSPHCLGDFGTYDNFFFIRGGISIDRTFREFDRLNGKKKTWFYEEELTFRELLVCLNLYKDEKPSLVLSHAAPAKIKSLIVDGDLSYFGLPANFDENTSLMMDECLKAHKPKMWIFGHLHKHFDEVIDGTRFICLPELGYIDV